MKNTFAFLFLLSALLLFIASPANAIAQSQTDNAHVSGTLTDPSGAAIAGVQIVAQPEGASSAAAVVAVSAADGAYTLTLPPGAYRLRFVERSFTTQETSLTLAPGESRVVN